MHSVDEEVHVGVVSVPVRDDQDLVLLQLERSDHTIRDTLHRRTIDDVVRVEAEREVVDRLVGAKILG
jgi:hypothetical protein